MVCYPIFDFSPKTRILHVHKHAFVKNKPNGMFNRKSMRLQKTLKITNEPILKNREMSVTKVLTNDYNRLDTWYRRKTKPFQSHFVQ